MNGKPGDGQNGKTPVFMVPIVDSDPMYIYCSQAQHCQQGMVMVINPPNDNAVQKYRQKAAQANNNVSPKGGMSGGSIKNNAAGTKPKSVLGGTAGDAAPATNSNGGNGNAKSKANNGGNNGNGKGNKN